MARNKPRKVELDAIGAPTADGQGGIYLLVNDPEPATTWYGPLWAKPHTPVGLINVISRHCRGQVRGYWVIDGALYICTPDLKLSWPEMDAAVSAALGMPIAKAR